MSIPGPRRTSINASRPLKRGRHSSLILLWIGLLVGPSRPKIERIKGETHPTLCRGYAVQLDSGLQIGSWTAQGDHGCS